MTNNEYDNLLDEIQGARAQLDKHMEAARYWQESLDKLLGLRDQEEARIGRAFLYPRSPEPRSLSTAGSE